MGLVASAHLGQRTSFLITSLAMHLAADKFEQRLHHGEIPQLISALVEQRRQQHELTQILPLLFLVFQDIMLELAVGKQAQVMVQDIETTYIQDKLSVVFSSKPEANKPFDHMFEFIGAEFKTKDCNNITLRPAQHVRQSLAEYFA